MSGEGQFPDLYMVPSHCVLIGVLIRVRGLSRVSFIRELNPSMRVLPHHLITHQRHYLQIPSPWVLKSFGVSMYEF
jgi:hypothetical protein